MTDGEALVERQRGIPFILLYFMRAVEIATPASLETQETPSVEGGSAGSSTVPPRPAGVTDRFAHMVDAVKMGRGERQFSFARGEEEERRPDVPAEVSIPSGATNTSLRVVMAC